MCTSPHPLIVYQYPNEEKKRTIFFRNFMDEAVQYGDIERNMRNLEGCNPELYTVACGQCYECRLAYSRSWANRCVLESLLYSEDDCFFVTLTYSPEKSSHLLNKFGALSLSGTDISAFIKRLRRYYEYEFNHYGIRFYSCGEYGDSTLRPHYHVLLYNCPLNDLEFICNNNFGDCLYNSKTLEKIWGFGMVVIGKLNWNTCAYTARYVMKKLKGVDSSYYDELDILPEFCRMSRKPGIGGEYFNLHWEDIYAHTSVDDDGIMLFNDSIILPSNGDKSNVVKPPRYFDKLLDEVDSERLQAIKANRIRWQQISEENRKMAMPLSDREYFLFKDDCIRKQNIGMFRKFQDLC